MKKFLSGFMIATIIAVGILLNIPWYWFVIAGLAATLIAILVLALSNYP